MGTWGSGNFDNDGALDYIEEIGEELVGRIEEILNDEERRAFDEDGEAVLMPTIEILSTLHDRFRMSVPETATVRRWKQQYLAVYDAQIDGLEPAAGYKEARRAIIEATFLKLEAQAIDYESHKIWRSRSAATAIGPNAADSYADDEEDKEDEVDEEDKEDEDGAD